MTYGASQQGMLSGKVAVVTGAGATAQDGLTGIGRATATALARAGARVALIDLDPALAEETRQDIVAGGGEAIVLQGDVSSESDCRRCVEQTCEQLGPPSILVNNVGVSRGRGRLDTLDSAIWDSVLAINLSGALYMSKYVAPHFVAAGGGALIHISSVAGMQASGAGVAYASSKGGLIAMSRELALMYGRDGVRSNVIMPGHIYTHMAAAIIDEKARGLRRKASPLNIEGTAWDVANAAVFLASDHARYITAACLPVDGGVTSLGAIAAYGLMSEA